MVIAVVGLIVIGPERLPRVARTMGHLFGRMQRYVSEIKADINREVELDELRKLQSTMREAAQEIEESVSKQVNFIEDEVKAVEEQTQKDVEKAVEPVAGINLMHSLNPPDYPEEKDGPSGEGATASAAAAEPGGEAPAVPTTATEADTTEEQKPSGDANKQA